MPNELAVRGEPDENDTVDEVAETINETDLFTVGEFALFRGTDGLDFNILRITKTVKRKKLGPRTKITGNFLTEQDVRDNGDRVFEENKEWKGGLMTFVHLVRDNQENVVSVCLREEVFIMLGDAFNEMVDLSREFEQSLLGVNTDDREDRLNSSGPKDTLCDQEDDNSDQEEQHIFLRERRNRIGRANRYQDLLVHLKYC